MGREFSPDELPLTSLGLIVASEKDHLECSSIGSSSIDLSLISMPKFQL